MLLVPRSMARERDPTCRDRWKFKSRVRRCKNVRRAICRIEFCATLANSTFLSSPNADAPVLARPSDDVVRFGNAIRRKREECVWEEERRRRKKNNEISQLEGGEKVRPYNDEQLHRTALRRNVAVMGHRRHQTHNQRGGRRLTQALQLIRKRRPLM